MEIDHWTPEFEWLRVEEKDRWMLDKLLLAKSLGYYCGPAGIDPERDIEYIVRPCVNVLGMGRGAYITDKEGAIRAEPGTFWCETFKGIHRSIDFYCGHVNGYCLGGKEGLRFTYWHREPNELAPIHQIPTDLYFSLCKYQRANVEMIGGKVIEVHFRSNPDLRHGVKEWWPVYFEDGSIPRNSGRYVDDEDGNRVGFCLGPKWEDGDDEEE